MRKVLIGLALAASAGTSSAQDVEQTPEGAQRFLSLLPRQAAIVAIPYRYSWPDAGIRVRIDSISSPAPCHTRFSGKISDYARDGKWHAARDAAQIREFVEKHDLDPGPYSVDWALVSKVSRISVPTERANSDDGIFDVVRIESADRYWQFLVRRDEALIKRIQYAMLFLKESCDRTAETGF